MFACWHTSLQVKTKNQNDWSVHESIKSVLVLILSIFVGCIYLNGPAFYEMNFTLCVLLVYNDNGSVQTLCVMFKVFAQTHCHYKPTIHKGWNSFYTLTLFSCVWILFYQSLSWKWLCFSWKSNGMHSKWKSLEKIVLCDSNLVIIDTKK